MDSTIIFTQSDFRCSICNKRVPQIALAIKEDKAICNLCDEDLFFQTYCLDVESDIEQSLRLLEITERQINLLTRELRKKIQGKSHQVDEIANYWSFKTNNKFTLSDSGRKSMEQFLNNFTMEEIQECIDIAFSKSTVAESGKFNYLCGILNAKLKERNRSPEYSEILKYWNYKRPQNWKKADEGKLELIIAKYPITKIKYYIDCLVDEERGWADFDSLISSLNETRFE